MSDKASTSGKTSTSEQAPTHASPESAPPEAAGEPEFRLSRGWVIVGIVAVLLGVLAGLVMSSSWLR